MTALIPSPNKVPLAFRSSGRTHLRVVNSISLKEGEAEFVRRARLCRRYGAAMIVMAFDEKGQAATLADKIRICVRAYGILTQEAGVDPQDIIFDANILTVGTGMAEHDRYALDFIEAVTEIKRLCPGVRTSGGLSNVSFAFAGNNKVREAIHSVFSSRRAQHVATSRKVCTVLRRTIHGQNCIATVFCLASCPRRKGGRGWMTAAAG